jgi:dienelactone hydrolase
MGRAFAAAILGIAMTISAQAAIVMKEVAYGDGATALKGYLAYDDAIKDKRPGLLVVHEWWGVTPHVKDFARYFASNGYTALAVDMYGRTAEDRKAAGELMNSVMGSPAVVKSRFDAARNVLASHPTVDPKRIGAIGFSMGGTVVLDMARAGEDLAAVASVYGNLATKGPARPGTMKSRVLVLHAEGDPFVKPESIEAFRNEMDAAKVDYRFVGYQGVKHGFSNPEATQNGRKYDMPIAYDAETDRTSRAEMLKFFSEIFGKR